MRVPLSKIKEIVCNKYNIDPSRLFMKGRKRDVVIARQAFAYLAYSINNKLGYNKLGEYMNLNHATVIHASKQVQGFIEFDKFYRAEISELYEECLKHSIEKIKIEEFNIKLVGGLVNKLLNCKNNIQLKEILQIYINKL
tara:strand:- start:16 stop:435 length:420 start_codon:yes stop_codon:yes gene_type:complete